MNLERRALDRRDDPTPRPRPAKILARWILALLAVVPLVIFAREFVGYTMTYSRTQLHPAAGVDGPPRAYYLDWRRDWEDLDALRKAAREGVMATPRALRKDGRLVPDPIGVIQGARDPRSAPG
ncbi:MAG: hypothetical protein R3E12_08895 [Candidatus Eisenbacteria bacterium]